MYRDVVTEICRLSQKRYQALRLGHLSLLMYTNNNLNYKKIHSTELAWLSYSTHNNIFTVVRRNFPFLRPPTPTKIISSRVFFSLITVASLGLKSVSPEKSWGSTRACSIWNGLSIAFVIHPSFSSGLHVDDLI